MSYNKLCCGQTILNDRLTLPDSKPDIDTILRTKSTPLIREIIFDKQYLIIYGVLTIGVEYAAVNPEGTQPVYFASFKSHFAFFLKLDHTAVSKKNCSVKVEYEQFEKAGPRHINKFIILTAQPAND